MPEVHRAQPGARGHGMGPGRSPVWEIQGEGAWARECDPLATSPVMLGRSTNTYTAPGVTSAASRAAQGTVVGVITTDASGNLASDGGALQNQADTNTANITR